MEYVLICYTVWAKARYTTCVLRNVLLNLKERPGILHTIPDTESPGKGVGGTILNEIIIVIGKFSM